MTCGWLTCFRRLNSDSRSRSSLGEAFSEMHISTVSCKPVPSRSHFCEHLWSPDPCHRSAQTLVISFPDSLPRFRQGPQGPCCSGLLLACRMVNSSLICLQGIITLSSKLPHQQGLSRKTLLGPGCVCKWQYFPAIAIFQGEWCRDCTHKSFWEGKRTVPCLKTLADQAFNRRVRPWRKLEMMGLHRGGLLPCWAHAS